MIAAFSIVSCADLKEIVESMDPNQALDDFEETCTNRKISKLKIDKKLCNW